MTLPYLTTKRALFATHLLSEPFVALFYLLAIILTKELQATSIQIGILTMLKPTVSLFSFYWGSRLSHPDSCLKRNLMMATGFSIIPFLFAPLSTNVNYFIAAAAFYQLFSRAAVPAMMEILKQNVGKDREKLYTQVSVAAYCVGAFLAIFLGEFFNNQLSHWQWLYFFSALILLLALIPQKAIVLDPIKQIENSHPNNDAVFGPLKNSFALLKEDRHFRTFEIGFFIAGFGLMFAIPAIPSFVTGLDISFTDLFVAMTALKGLGFVCTSHIWSKKLDLATANKLAMSVFFAFALFLSILLMVKISIVALFIAYLVYGIAQAGSHLVWNLSGVLFSGAKSSTLYSSVNILCVGLRGMIAPPIGGIISYYFGPEVAIFLGAGFCLLGSYYIYRNREKSIRHA